MKAIIKKKVIKKPLVKIGSNEMNLPLFNGENPWTLKELVFLGEFARTFDKKKAQEISGIKDDHLKKLACRGSVKIMLGRIQEAWVSEIGWTAVQAKLEFEETQKLYDDYARNGTQDQLKAIASPLANMRITKLKATGVLNPDLESQSATNIQININTLTNAKQERDK